MSFVLYTLLNILRKVLSMPIPNYGETQRLVENSTTTIQFHCLLSSLLRLHHFTSVIFNLKASRLKGLRGPRNFVHNLMHNDVLSRLLTGQTFPYRKWVNTPRREMRQSQKIVQRSDANDTAWGFQGGTCVPLSLHTDFILDRVTKNR